MYHQRAIESFPLQTYASALLFSPTASLMRQLFQHEEPEGITIKPGTSDSWSACLQTLEGHSDRVYSVAFSHDSTRLASASDDSTVKIWDASSGACLQTLEGYSKWVNSTDLVFILLPHTVEPQQTIRQRIAISSDGTWIPDGAQNILWLQTEYRPSCSATSSSSVSLGTGSGKVWVCCFTTKRV